MTTWNSGSSIAFELDLTVSAICEYTAGFTLPSAFGDLLRSIPADLNTGIRELFHTSPGWSSVMEYLTWMAGTQFEEDYSLATLPLRNLTAAAALDRLAIAARPYHLAPNPALPDRDALVDLAFRLRLALYEAVHIQVDPISPFKERLRRELAFAAGILAGGEYHRLYWRLLDRLNFEFYTPWRETRAAHMAELRERLISGAGALAGSGRLELDWLPDQNPLWYQTGLRDAVTAGQVNIFFVIEPFGMADSFELYPGWVGLTLAQPGVIYENFQEFALDVSSRANALADPTRLTILRLIRHFGMTNTEIAKYLNISRPTVSIHARILREAGLIHSEQVGREMRHTVVPEEIDHLFSDLRRFLDISQQTKDQK